MLQIDGKEVASGHNLSLRYIGSGRNLTWLVNRLYDSFEVISKVRVRSPLALRRTIGVPSPEGDLLIVDAGWSGACLMPSDSALHVPSWVRQRLRLGRDWPAVEASFARETRNKAERYLRKYGYTCSFSTGSRDFFIFYHKFYRPTLKRRFAGEAIVVPLDRFLAQCQHGYLLQLRHEGEVRAAALLQRSGRRLVSLWGGELTGDESAHLKGLADVLDYCIIRHAAQMRCRTLDLGPSRPRLFDGVLQHKKKWGAKVGFAWAPNSDLILRLLRMNVPIASFLGNAGLLVRDPVGPVAKLMFADRTCTAADLDHLYTRYAADGVVRYDVGSVAGFSDDAQQWARNDGRPVRLIDLAASARPESEFCGSGVAARRPNEQP
ncbi:MAG: GNAT family N-acetyltransferase [Gammaproteobacteria bacterium]|nr:GNAT family N-acetyltransferase [Gammaproteobacteria bacterium]